MNLKSKKNNKNPAKIDHTLQGLLFKTTSGVAMYAQVSAGIAKLINLNGNRESDVENPDVSGLKRIGRLVPSTRRAITTNVHVELVRA